MKTIANLINIAQQDKNLYPHDVALNAGVDWKLYQYLSTGAINPGIDFVAPQIWLIADYLGIPKSDVRAAMSADLLDWWDR